MAHRCREHHRKLLCIAVVLCGAVVLSGWAAPPAQALTVKRLTPFEIELLHHVLETLHPTIVAKKQDGSAILLTWKELYDPLPVPLRLFLDEFLGLEAEALGSTSHHFGQPLTMPLIVPVGRQTIRDRTQGGRETVLDPQYLPKPVLEAYQRMMDAMELDLGRRLLIESGYRSAAYQLYLFVHYLPKHNYSVVETNRFVALPGYSEHGYPPRQAIDFINEEGINGEDHPEEFEALPEYQWLAKHAKGFGFALSYPRNNAYHTAFEPWHWHYCASAC